MTGRKEKTPLSDRVADLAAAVAVARTRARELVRDRQAAERDVDRLHAERVEAFAKADEKTAERLRLERVQAEARVRDLAERAAGAELASQRAEAERAEFATHNFDALVCERESEAQRVTAGVKEALGALVDAQAAWEACAGEVMALARLAGRDTRSVPQFPAALNEVTRAIRRAAADVPVPFPVTAGHRSGVATVHERAIRAAV